MPDVGIHQVVTVKDAGDPALRDALGLQRFFQSRGIRSEVFAREVPPSLVAIVRPYTDRAKWSRPTDLLLARSDSPRDWIGGVASGVGHPPLFTPEERERNGEQAEHALAAARIHVPEQRTLRIVIVSGEGRSGILTYSQALADGLRANGHAVEFVGVPWRKTFALIRKMRAIPKDTDLVILEHEFAFFRDAALIAGMAVLKRRGLRVLLSLHELEPDKFRDYVRLYTSAHFEQRGNLFFEVLRIPYSVLLVAYHMLRYRITLFGLGLFPDRILVHSEKAMKSVTLLTSDTSRVDEIPHFVEPLEGMPDVVLGATEAGRRVLRRELGLPEDGVVVVSPGFLFKRKRLIEVAGAMPRDTTLVIAGTGVTWHGEGDYPARIKAFVAERDLGNVVVDESYERMPKHLLAADAVVLYYKDIYQSGIASHAIWAEKPLVLSDIQAFRMYEGAALFASDERELRARLEDIRDPAVRARLTSGARELKALLTPDAMALRYLAHAR